MAMEKPLVSLTIICYKAERFVREAIQGALAQTYSPLEIIFSDDASPDRTFEIIQEELKGYTGPHRVVLNRNEKNMGIGAHVSHVWLDIAKGDWIVVSAGDDVSNPGRVERLMQVAHSGIAAIHHNCTLINDESEEIHSTSGIEERMAVFARESVEEIILTNQWLMGMTMCLNRKMLQRFGPFIPEVVNEDNILAYRAQHYGKILYLDEKLMKYRIHEASVSYVDKRATKEAYTRNLVRNARGTISIYKQIKADDRILKLSRKVWDELDRRLVCSLIDLFVYTGKGFEVSFIFTHYFYKAILKRIFLVPRLTIKSN